MKSRKAPKIYIKKVKYIQNMKEKVGDNEKGEYEWAVV